MSSKSHFICEYGIEGFEETNEPQSIFGKFTGYNVYLTIEPNVLKSVKIKDDFLYVEVKDTTHLPKQFKIWGDAVLEADVDEDGLLVILKGGHHITRRIINLDFPT